MSERKIEFHEYCLLFPLMEKQALVELAHDIARNGLGEAIVLHEGKILDGRNRYLACEIAGIMPHFIEYSGSEPLKYVISKNLHRRHMDKSQFDGVVSEVLCVLRENINNSLDRDNTSKNERR